MKFTKHTPDCPRRDEPFHIISSFEGDGCPDCEMIEEELDDREALRHISSLIGKEVDEAELTEHIRQTKAGWN